MRNGMGASVAVEHLAWKNRGEDIKVGAKLGYFRVDAINRFNSQQTIILLIVFRGAHLARDHIACAQSETSDLRLGDVHVHIPWQETSVKAKTETVLYSFHHTRTNNASFLVEVALEQTEAKTL